MAVLNPPRALPGLGRAVVNFLVESRSTWSEGVLVDTFRPKGLNESEAAVLSVKNTLSAFRAIGILANDDHGAITIANSVKKHGSPIGRDAFRRLMLNHVFDVNRDGDPWAVSEGEASTSGARDLTRGLSWFLAQDALAAPLNWNENVQKMQADQFGPGQNAQWPFSNSNPWNAFTRWAPALGLAVPSVVKGNTGLVPLPTLAVADAIDEMAERQIPIRDFLDALAVKIPILPGGVIRNGLARRLNFDPDPGLQGHSVDTSVAQVLRILEARGRLQLENLADADGVSLSRSSPNRTTHVTLKGGKKK